MVNGEKEEEHDYVSHRVYLQPCKECLNCKIDPRTCDFTVYGICSICGELKKQFNGPKSHSNNCY